MLTGLIAFAALAVVVGMAVAIPVKPSNEPSYQGKKLSEWVIIYAAPARTNKKPEREVAADAIRHIGSNAVPYLLEWMRYEPPGWKQKFYQILKSVPAEFKGDWNIRDQRQARGDAAVNAICISGPHSLRTVQELARMLDDPGAFEGAMRAALALACLGGRGVEEPLTRLSATQPTPHPHVRRIMDAMRSFGLNTRPALPMLLECVRSQEDDTVFWACWNLGEMKLDAPLAVPALAGRLQHSDESIRFAAARSLGNFGSEARVAVPALLNLLQDTEGSVRQAAEVALRKIAPDALPRVGSK